MVYELQKREQRRFSGPSFLTLGISSLPLSISEN